MFSEGARRADDDFYGDGRSVPDSETKKRPSRRPSSCLPSPYDPSVRLEAAQRDVRMAEDILRKRLGLTDTNLDPLVVYERMCQVHGQVFFETGAGESGIQGDSMDENDCPKSGTRSISPESLTVLWVKRLSAARVNVKALQRQIEEPTYVFERRLAEQLVQRRQGRVLQEVLSVVDLGDQNDGFGGMSA
jgi:hypothetical protein